MKEDLIHCALFYAVLPAESMDLPAEVTVHPRVEARANRPGGSTAIIFHPQARFLPVNEEAVKKNRNPQFSIPTTRGRIDVDCHLIEMLT